MNEHDALAEESTSEYLKVECVNNVIVVTPSGDLGEFVVNTIGGDAERALKKFQETHECRHVVIDFCHTDYFGSSALGLFVRLWKRARERGGRMALCNLSEHEIEVLKVVRLNELWAICDSLEDAKSVVLAEP